MHPVLFQIGSFVVGTYGLMIVAGMLLGLGLVSRLARRRGLDPEFFFDLTFVLLLSGMLGARLVYIGTEWQAFLKDPLALLLSRQGFVFLGGFACALVAGIWFTRRRHMPLLETCDLVAPAIALAHSLGRVGCFLAGCCYGEAVIPGQSNALERLLAVRFPLVTGQAGQMFNFAYQGQIAQGLIDNGAPAPLPLLPVQLFESFGNLLICLALLWAWRRRRFSGQIFALYLLLYGVLRFSLEFIRGDAERGVFLNGRISISQIICIFAIGAGAMLWRWRYTRGIDPLPLPAGGAPAAAANSRPAPAGRKARPASKRARVD